MLFSNGFTTTVELTTTMDENEVREILEEKFVEKYEKSSKRPKFEFVRAVHTQLFHLKHRAIRAPHVMRDF